jgi:nuclear pore complex protein Nup43
MENYQINGSFVSEKISKIRFVHQQYEDTEKFVTGSWNHSKNTVKLYRFEKPLDDSLDVDYQPKCICSVPVAGDVTGLEWIDYNNFAVSSSSGIASLFYLSHGSSDGLKENFRFSDLHQFSCTGLSVFEEDVATIGEDGW